MKNAKKLYPTNLPTIHYGGEKRHTSTCNCSDNCNTKAVTGYCGNLRVSKFGPARIGMLSPLTQQAKP